MLYGRLVQVAETFTDLQILGCELQKNAFGGPAGGDIALPRPLAVIRGRGWREVERRKGKGME